MSNAPRPEKIMVTADLDATVAFAPRHYGSRDWIVQTINPETGRFGSRTFASGDEDGLRAFLADKVGVENIYFQVNPLKRRLPLNGKASKKDVAAVHYLQVDMDPSPLKDFTKERARILKALEECNPKPNIIIDSGGGYQAFWKLTTPLEMLPREDGVEPWEEAESLSRQLALQLSADKCSNVDRIMRFPGTINVPDKKKLAKGRKPALAKVVYWDEGSYSLSAFPRPPSTGATSPDIRKQTAEATGANALAVGIRRFTIDELKRDAQQRGNELSDYTAMLIVKGGDPDKSKKDPSRSEPQFRVTIDLVKAGFSDEVIASVLTDPDYGVSATVREKKPLARYVERQIRNAKHAASDFIRNDKDVIDRQSRHNVQIALAKLEVRVGLNAFSQRYTLNGLGALDGDLSDAAVNRLWLQTKERFGFLPTRQFFKDAVLDIARDESFHPIIEYIGGLVWDGVHRLDDWLITYLKAEATALNRALGAIVLIAAVRRVRQPGVKFDEMLVLQGAQGVGKSSAIAILAVNPAWFSDNSPIGLEGRETLERISGFWLIEISELSGFRKKDTEDLKATLSRQTDRARLPYASIPVEVPRQCIFIGTTNADAFLEDQTGNRRFLVVSVGDIDLEALKRDRDQLWAEAASREAKREDISLPTQLRPAAAEVQERYQVGDAFVDQLRNVIGDLNGWVLATDVRRIIGKPTGQFQASDDRRMGQAMRTLGFGRTKKRINGSPTHVYWRGTLDHCITISVLANGQVHAANSGDEGPY